jgi:hypothetical protein
MVGLGKLIIIIIIIIILTKHHPHTQVHLPTGPRSSRWQRQAAASEKCTLS